MTPWKFRSQTLNGRTQQAIEEWNIYEMQEYGYFCCYHVFPKAAGSEGYIIVLPPGISKLNSPAPPENFWGAFQTLKYPSTHRNCLVLASRGFSAAMQDSQNVLWKEICQQKDTYVWSERHSVRKGPVAFDFRLLFSPLFELNGRPWRPLHHSRLICGKNSVVYVKFRKRWLYSISSFLFWKY